MKNVVEDLQHDVGLKEALLETVTKENEELVQKFRNLKKSEEHSTKVFKCGKCAEEFVNNENLRKHEIMKHEALSELKMKFLKLENQLMTQKLKLVNTISNLKEIEFEEKQSCSCRGMCYISHQKHNWKSSQSESFLLKMDFILEANLLFVKFFCLFCGK